MYVPFRILLISNSVWHSTLAENGPAMAGPAGPVPVPMEVAHLRDECSKVQSMLETMEGKDHQRRVIYEPEQCTQDTKCVEKMVYI